MGQPIVSVILPFYNGEKYLKQCLDSVTGQTLKEIEIICVDDGSSDRTLEMLQAYEKKDERIKVLHQENAGAGAARNRGLAAASGKYLSFLDSDDFFEPDMLESAAAKLEEDQADFVVFGCDQYLNDTRKFRKITYAMRKPILPPYMPFNHRQITGNVFKAFVGWAWDKLYRRDFILEHGLSFQEQRTSNDLLFVFSALVLAKRITCLDRVLAHQRRNDASSLSNTREKSWFCFYDALCALRNMLKEHGLYGDLEKDFINYALHFSLWNLNTIAGDSYFKLYDKLKEEWFADLGIAGHGADYFYEQREYDQYACIMQYTAQEYREKQPKEAPVPETKEAPRREYRIVETGHREEQTSKTKKEAGMPKVSIIIPTYNVEEYLVECMDSVTRQTLPDLEIICVNDGSTDSSLEILKSYAEKDPRIVLIDKENGGYGMAMNIGLDRATGEYIGIVEPDDYVPLNMYEDLYGIAKEHDLDLLKADFYRFKRSSETGDMELAYQHLSKFPEDYNKVFDPSHTPDAIRFIMNTWSGIYRRAFLEEYHIRHHETPGASFQDNGFYFQTFIYAKRGMILDKPYYMNRRDNPNSSVHSKEKVYCMNVEYDYIREILMKDREIWERFKYMYWFKKQANYMSTALRIGDEYKREYIHRFSQEYNRAREMGELDRELFGQKTWEELEFIMKDPDGFYYNVLLMEQSNQEFKALRKRLYDVENSTSWKLGYFLTAVPRNIKEALKRRRRRAAMEK